MTRASRRCTRTPVDVHLLQIFTDGDDIVQTIAKA
jgi:hypothetical protein